VLVEKMKMIYRIADTQDVERYGMKWWGRW